jgi:hypothetical protein
MNSAVEIENAIRGLPAGEARAVAEWLQQYLAREASDRTTAQKTGAFDKWVGCGQLPVGINTDDYLRLIRDGNGS